jgi:hypothetical protein
MIRDIRVIRGQTDARHSPAQFRDLQCHSVAASLSPFANLAPLRETHARQYRLLVGGVRRVGLFHCGGLEIEDREVAGVVGVFVFF